MTADLGPEAALPRQGLAPAIDTSSGHVGSGTKGCWGSPSHITSPDTELRTQLQGLLQHPVAPASGAPVPPWPVTDPQPRLPPSPAEPGLSPCGMQVSLAQETHSYPGPLPRGAAHPAHSYQDRQQPGTNWCQARAGSSLHEASGSRYEPCHGPLPICGSARGRGTGRLPVVTRDEQ